MHEQFLSLEKSRSVFEGRFMLILPLFFRKVVWYLECRGIQFVWVNHTEKRSGEANLTDLEGEPVWKGTNLEGFYLRHFTLLTEANKRCL